MHEWLTCEDVARELKLFNTDHSPNITLVQRMIRRGDLPGTKVARFWRVRRDRLDTYIERLANPDPWKRTRHAEAARNRRSA